MIPIRVCLWIASARPRDTWLNGVMSPSTSLPTPEAASAQHRIIDRVEALEREQRARDAERMSLLAAALAGALDPESAEGTGGGPAAPAARRGPPTFRPGMRELRYRALRAEIATVRQQSERCVDAELSAAHALTSQYTRTHEALGAGEIALDHAIVITSAGTTIGPGDDAETVARRGAYEAAVVSEATRTTAHRLRPIAARLAAQVSPRSLAEQHTAARERRSVRLVDLENGMADLVAHLPLSEAHAIHDRVTRIATAVRRAPQAAESAQHGAEERSLDQLRADALADLLLAASPTGLFAGSPEEAVQARIQLIVPAPVHGDAGSLPPPPELVGRGLVDGDTVGSFLLNARWWERITTTAAGEITAIDRYRPGAALRKLLRARDLHCRFPGCRVPAHRCDIDHTIDYTRGGATAQENLVHLCRGHHSVKHHTAWRSTQAPDGTLTWETPTGRRRAEPPPSRVRFARLTLREPPSGAGPGPRRAVETDVPF